MKRLTLYEQALKRIRSKVRYRCDACEIAVLADPERDADKIKAHRCTACFLHEAAQRLNRRSA